MIHARSDYDRIQDPAGLIGADEPVFLVRAKDKCAPATVRAWAAEASAHGADDACIGAALRWAERMEEWQAANRSKVPDAPDGVLKP